MARKQKSAAFVAKREIEFSLDFPQANVVMVAGTFNEWNPASIPLSNNGNGVWRVRMTLAPGRYEYRFIVDGEWQNDPHAKECEPNEFGSTNCVLNVK